MSTLDCKDGASKSNGLCEMNDMLQNIRLDNNSVSVCDKSACANCGKEGDNLKACTACKMVKYCDRECQIAHRPQHKKECRRRAAELHDERLFKQPPPAEDCPICFLRLPSLNPTGSKYMTCCGMRICSGCVYAPVYDDRGNIVVGEKCPFCRTPPPTSEAELRARKKKRIEAGDVQAIFHRGCDYRDGTNGLPQDYNKALELFYRSGELGDAQAYSEIGYAYKLGEGVEVDKKKAMHYYELGAMRGILLQGTI